MKKKNLKPLILSSLAAVAMAGVGTGATFALFTDKAETQINVTAGTVHVKTEVEIVEAYELGDVAMTKDTETKYHNSIGGKVEWVDNELKLENWAPGDKVILKVTNTNLSNVATKTRLVQKHSSTTEKDLFDALEVNYEATSKHQSITGSIFRWASVPAASGATGDLLSEITLTIEFPNVGTEITERTVGDNNIYQGMNTSISFAQEAVQGNAEVQSLVDDLDAVMVPSATVNRSLTEALTEVNNIADEESIKNEGLVWNVATDRFLYEGEVSGAKLNYFKIYDAMPEAQSYSIYATDAWNATSVEGLEVGFDAGSSSVVNVAVRTEKNITITVATKGGTLTVYAPNATVNHYGPADRVDVTSVAGNSYHEFGSVVVASLKKGHIALEEGSNVLALHLEKTVTGTETKFDSLKVSLAENVALPELSRDSVGLELNETLKVVEIASEQAGQTSSEFIYLSGNGTFEDSKVLVASEDDATLANPVAKDDASEAAKALANTKVNAEAVDTGKKATAVVQPFAAGVVYSSATKKIYTEEELNGDITSVFNAGGTATLLKDYVQNSIVMLGKEGSDNIIDIDGRGHKLTVKNNKRAVRITRPNCDIKFRNIQIENAKQDDDDLRCVSFDSTSSGSKVLFDGCSLSAGYYTINATAASNLDITIKNGTVAAGWAAINSYSSNSKWTVINSVLKGLNDKGESSWNNFNTITFDGGCLGGGTTGKQGSNNELTITNSTIYASSESSNIQHWIGLQYGTSGNRVTVDNQTRIINVNGEDESAAILLGYYYGNYNQSTKEWSNYYENTSWVRVGDTKYELLYDPETGRSSYKITQIVELP